MTARERAFCSAVNETSSARPISSNANAAAARAASLANPCPHASRASRQPISTAGVKWASKSGRASPVNPRKRCDDRSSTAHSPKPSCSNDCTMRSTLASLSLLVSTLGK